MNLRIENGRIIDPANKVDRVGTLVIRKGKIDAIEKPAAKGRAGKSSFDASGMVVCPGLIDMHVHFRDPGQEYKEDIATGAEAAIRGGFTSVACMPNTDPVNDNPSVTEYMIKKAERVDLIRLHPIAAITKNLAGKVLTEFGALRQAGAVGFSDDGMPTTSGIMRRALEYASQFDMPVIDHCEDPELTKDASMHEGRVSCVLGLRGWPAAAESNIVYRNIHLAAMTGAHIHIAHISAAESVAQVRAGKRQGIRVTAEVSPHHLSLEDEELTAFDTNMKVNPPLRDKKHVKAVIQGLKSGAIDAIATDHAPHADFEKQSIIEGAPFGMLGLQTALSIGLDLCQRGVLTLPELIAKFTVAPASILKLKQGHLSAGADADVTIFDPAAEHTFEKSVIVSKSNNSPFLGRKLHGRVIRTLFKGRAVYSV